MVAIPGAVLWSYLFFIAVLAAGLITGLLHGDWQRARGFDRLLFFGPLFYAAPLTAFGVEHFTQTKSIASLIPRWIPWHLIWTYLIGTGFVLAGFSLVTRILASLAARLVALTFFVFVVVMDVPAWATNPGDRFAMALALRELAFCGGALALASALARSEHGRGAEIAAAVARYFLAVPIVVYSAEQLMHGNYVPGIPLRQLTPDYVYGHALWTYLSAAAYGVTGVLLVAGIKTRLAATWAAVSVLIVELFVYVPMAVVERGSLKGINFLADTLMFCGAVLLLAGAVPNQVNRGGATA